MDDPESRPGAWSQTVTLKRRFLRAARLGIREVQQKTRTVVMSTQHAGSNTLIQRVTDAETHAVASEGSGPNETSEVNVGGTSETSVGGRRIQRHSEEISVSLFHNVHKV